MAGGSESRRSMASASVAAHRAEANVADARLARYNDRIGRVRKERTVWPGAAFIVEALLLLVFLLIAHGLNPHSIFSFRSCTPSAAGRPPQS